MTAKMPYKIENNVFYLTKPYKGKFASVCTPIRPGDKLIELRKFLKEEWSRRYGK